MKLMETYSTPWYQSKVIVAVLVGMVLKIAGLWFGYTYDLQQISGITDYLVIAIPTAVTFATDFVAVWGRITAKHTIGSN